MSDTDLLTARQAAAELGISTTRIYHGSVNGFLPMAHKGDGTPKNPNLFRRSDLLEWKSNAKERELAGKRIGGSTTMARRVGKEPPSREHMYLNRLESPYSPSQSRPRHHQSPSPKKAQRDAWMDQPFDALNAVLFDIWQMDRRASAESAQDVARHERDAGDRRESAAAAVREAA